MKTIFEEIAAERVRQNEKWGEQNHPSVDLVLAARVPFDPQRMCEEYEIPSETRAKQLTDLNAERGTVTYAHIITEELSEAVSCENDTERRKELIQLAACVVQWIERIDRLQAQEGGEQ